VGKTCGKSELTPISRAISGTEIELTPISLGTEIELTPISLDTDIPFRDGNRTDTDIPRQTPISREIELTPISDTDIPGNRTDTDIPTREIELTPISRGK
jgi:hypothetical protein